MRDAANDRTLRGQLRPSRGPGQRPRSFSKMGEERKQQTLTLPVTVPKRYSERRFRFR